MPETADQRAFRIAYQSQQTIRNRQLTMDAEQKRDSDGKFGSGAGSTSKAAEYHGLMKHENSPGGKTIHEHVDSGSAVFHNNENWSHEHRGETIKKGVGGEALHKHLSKYLK